MTDSIKISRNFLTVNGKRAGIWICTGPWVEGVNPDLIKLRCKRNCFPAEIRNAVKVTNNSDCQTDYFEADTIRLLPGDDLYEAARTAAA